MDNNNQPENSEGKKSYNKYNNNYRRKKNSQKPAVKDSDESSPNGSITVKPGRYDLPPEAADKVPAPKPERRDSQYRSRQKSEPRAEVNSSDGSNGFQENPPRENAANSPQKKYQQNQKRKPYNRRRNNRDQREQRSQHEQREQSKNISAEQLLEITEEENAISEYIAVTAPADGSPSEAEIREELNSAPTAEEVPGTEQPVDQSYASESVAETVAETVSVAESESESTTDEAEPETDIPEEPLRTFEIIGVRFKANGKIYYFDPDGHILKRNDPVVVDTARGLEFGTVDVGNRLVTEREVVLPLKKLVRRATPDDIERSEANAARAAEAFVVCGEKIAEHKLEMKLVDVEYTFDNSKLLFYFTAEGRVDFRELVKDLASVFRTRIELRQIGIRDETKLLGGIGICGRPFCCKTFLSDFVQVSIKMAKEQNLSLNSAKISGACGRLMCCLRYEYDTYAEEIRKTPKVDQIVSTPDGEGTVIEVQPLAGLCRVRLSGRPDTPPKVYHRDLLTVVGGKGAKKTSERHQKSDSADTTDSPETTDEEV